MNEIHHVKTGIPGLFYRKPSPDEPYFVEEGVTVAVGDTLGLVEIMKSFHPVRADMAGVVMRFLVEEADEVTPGQSLVEIRVAE